MDGMMIFQIVSTSIGVGVPVATLLYNAGKFGQRIKNLEEGHKECREERIRAECDLYNRLSSAETGIAYQKGQMNGIKGVPK